ncbi:hypothetical protein GGH13_004979 [Coemansia sp. S155-1]|nr:hypothetical protein GGH13_004979 [Coemansia sp. S155-1]
MAAMIIQACTDTAYTYVTLPNDMPESPPTAKCQQLNQQVCDGAAQVTTSKDLMEVVRPIIFFNIGTVANICELATSRPLIPTGVEPQCFVALELAGLEGFSRWRPLFAVIGSTMLNGLNLLLPSQLLQQF